MRTLKKTAAIAMSVVVLLTSGVTTKAAITDAQPAKSSSEAELKWQWPEKTKGVAYNTISDLKIVGDYIYAADNGTKTIVKINKETGKTEAKHDFSDSCALDYYADIAYGDNKVYVGYTNNKVEAFDADTLDSKWVSDEVDHAVTSKLVYDNKHLYFGTGTYGDNDGTYYVLDTDNGKEKTIVKSTSGLFYWKKAIKVGTNLVISDTSGNLTSINTRDNSVVESKNTGNSFNGNIAYDETYKTIYFINGSNELYGVSLNDDGTFGEVERKLQFTSGYSAMTPVIYNGKIYASGTVAEPFGSDNKYNGYFGVANITASGCTLGWTVPIFNYSQCEPVIAKTETNSVQVYFTINSEPGGIYSINDSKDATLNKIFEPTDTDEINYCMRDIVVDNEGTMYYSNDAGYIFAIGKKSTKPTEPTEPTKPTEPTQPTTSIQPTTTVTNETKVKPVTKTVTSTRNVKLTWKKQKGAKGYEIYAKAGKGKYKKLTTVGAKTSKTVKVNKDSAYKFKVKPYKTTKTNKKKYYKTYAAKAKFGNKTVKATFKNVTGYASYQVEMKAGKAAYKKVKTTTKGGTITYTKKKAKVGTTYKFRLKGINKVNGKNVTTVIK